MLSNAERNVIMERNIFVLSFPYITIAEGFFMERKVVLITGGSSGIGLAAAKSLLDRGCLVYEISRREHSENGIVHIGADVTDEAAVTTAVDRIIQETGRIDTLINNAGYGISEWRLRIRRFGCRRRAIPILSPCRPMRFQVSRSDFSNRNKTSFVLLFLAVHSADDITDQPRRPSRKWQNGFLTWIFSAW